ncbi:hypothetical protein [Halobacillus sp. A5]|uniref:hypothetical protein n=1 Tax=Halobacillus sp. A5 TaxID=2880263 RepID=UPI0020A699A6|nr:hypothetical protein [Halobacillus sp. A5]MCP3028452.1 hypothetical protein [Halobacillus sp. A5]
MLSNLLWGLLLLLLVLLLVYLDKRKQKNRYVEPHLRRAQQEKEVERAIEKEKSFRGGPPSGDL